MGSSGENSRLHGINLQDTRLKLSLAKLGQVAKHENSGTGCPCTLGVGHLWTHQHTINAVHVKDIRRIPKNQRRSNGINKGRDLFKKCSNFSFSKDFSAANFMQVFEPWTRLKPSRHLPVASQLLLPGQNSGFSWNPDPSVLSYLSLFTNHQHKTLTCVLSVCQHVGSWKRLYDRNAYRARFIIFTYVIVCLF